MLHCSIRRAGNVLEIKNGVYVVSVLQDTLGYRYRKFYAGMELAQRKRTLDAMLLNNDPRAKSFRPELDIFPMTVYQAQADGSLLTPAGVLSRVIGAFKANGITYDYTDCRTKKLPPADYSRLQLLPSGFKFRNGQDTALATIDGLDGCIIVAPTGFGKSWLARLACMVYPTSKILFVTPGLDTVRSVYADLQAALLTNVGCVGGGKRIVNKRVTVASVDSLHLVDLASMDLIIGDECHEYGSQTRMAAFSRFTEAKMVGLSASFPGRGDGADLVVEALFGPPSLRISYQDAVDAGSVVPLRVYMLEINQIAGYVNNKSGAAWERAAYWRNSYRNWAFSNFIETKLPQLMELGDKPQTLYMVDTVDHLIHARKHLGEVVSVYAEPADKQAWAEQVNRWTRMKLWGQDEVTVSSKLRDVLRKQFESGIIRKAISTGCWKQGVNFKQLQILARLDGGTSEIENTQIPGRLSRISDGKELGVLIDSTDGFDAKAKSRAERRMSFYRKMGWDVHRVQVQ